MSKFARYSVWLSRLFLIVTAIAFGRVAWLYLTNPAAAAAASDFTAGSAAAITSLRVGFGGFHLGCAVIALAGAVWPKWLIPCLAFVATMMGAVVSARILGIIVDGPAARSFFVLRVEGTVFVLVIIALILERLMGGRRQSATVSA